VTAHPGRILSPLITVLAVAAGVLLVCAAVARPQSVTPSAPLTSAHGPDCNLAERRFDSYISAGTKGGFIAPRWEHETIRVGLSVSTTELAHVLFRRGPVASASIAAVTVGVVPHVAQLIEHRPVDPRDAVADAFLASVPLIAVTGLSAHSWQGAVLAATTILGGYLAAACWASP